MHRAPSATFAQNRLVRSSSDSVRDWIAAEDNPKSRSRSAIPITDMTIATRPNSDGVSSRASMIRDANWRRSFTA